MSLERCCGFGEQPDPRAIEMYFVSIFGTPEPPVGTGASKAISPAQLYRAQRCAPDNP